MNEKKLSTLILKDFDLFFENPSDNRYLTFEVSKD
ncbi:unnamed protein product, partial [marine sediment metagenome]